MIDEGGNRHRECELLFPNLCITEAGHRRRRAVMVARTRPTIATVRRAEMSHLSGLHGSPIFKIMSKPKGAR